MIKHLPLLPFSHFLHDEQQLLVESSVAEKKHRRLTHPFVQDNHEHQPTEERERERDD
jgi:hypothetical protein